MTDGNDRLQAIEGKLDEHSKALQGIQNTLNKVAVQHEQISRLQVDVQTLQTNWNRLIEPRNGVISRMSDFQASCPRRHVRWLWVIIIPQGFALLALGAAAIRYAF